MLRCVWTYRGRSLEIHSRFPAKLSKSGPDKSKRIVGLPRPATSRCSAASCCSRVTARRTFPPRRGVDFQQAARLRGAGLQQLYRHMVLNLFWISYSCVQLHGQSRIKESGLQENGAAAHRTRLRSSTSCTGGTAEAAA